jgi:hypothetical protein
MEAFYRILNFEAYLQTLHQAIKDNEIKNERLTPMTYTRLIDAFLLGSASERIAGDIFICLVFKF